MPKKEHKLEAISVTEETHSEIARLAKEQNKFEYEIVEEAIQEFLNKNK